MVLMCSEAPSEAQFSCIHNKLLAWKRNDLAMMLIINLLVVPWHLFGPGSGHFTWVTQVAERYRNEDEREGERGQNPCHQGKPSEWKPLVTSSCICSRPCPSFFLSFLPSFLSPRLSAVIGVLSAAAALSPYLFPHLPPHSFACAIGVLLDRRFVCRCCLVFSPTKRNIATTSIDSNPQVNASIFECRHDFNIWE